MRFLTIITSKTKNLIKRCYYCFLAIIYLKNPWIILIIPFMKRFKLIPKAGDSLTIEKKQFFDYIRVFKKGWICTDGIWSDGFYKYKLIEPFILLEDIKKDNSIEKMQGENMINVGGLYGETAITAIKELRVNKVFIYEPIKENVDLINSNMLLNNCGKQIEVNAIGISNQNGNFTIQSEYAPGSAGFGMPGNKYSAVINVNTWDTVFKRHSDDKIFLAKVDCEGAEKYLIESDSNSIKRIPNWIIETHSKKIEEDIVDLFTGLGFKSELREIVNIKKHVNVWYFWREN